jgi:hypothetical protein
MANTGEPLINVVICERVKDADRRELWPDQEFMPLLAQTSQATGGQAEPTPSMVRTRNVVSPTPSLGDSVPQGALMGQRVEEARKSESGPVTGPIGVALPGATSPHVKARRLLAGLGSRENLINRPRR